VEKLLKEKKHFPLEKKEKSPRFAQKYGIANRFL